MEVENGFLVEDDGRNVLYIESPNKKGKLDPRFVIIHCTYGPTAVGAINTLTGKDPGKTASAHFVIDRDGVTTQLVPLSTVAFHTGKAQVGRLTKLDKYSIGIEAVNEGMLKKDASGLWTASVSKRLYKEEEVLVATHKFGKNEYAWQLYTPKQIEKVFSVAKTVVAKFEIEDVLGHDEISPKRKWDPGPAFPTEELRKQIFGRTNTLHSILVPGEIAEP